MLLIPGRSLFASRFDSIFAPRVHNSFAQSLLQDNILEDEYIYVPADSGFSHPFASLRLFGDAFTEVFQPGTPKKALFSYRHPDLKADFNIYAGFEANYPKSGSYGFLYKGWTLNAIALDKLYLHTDWYNGAFGGNLSAAEDNILIDSWKKDGDTSIMIDNMRGEFAYEDAKAKIALGRGNFQAGNSLSGSIILSDYSNDYGYLLAEMKLGDFRFALMHASLVADSLLINPSLPYYNNQRYPDKFLSFHQLNWQAGANTELFLGETVVYGNRGIDLNYLLPNAFWRATEHNLGDRDNMMLFGGLNQALPKDALFYLQIAIDEFSYGKLFSSWWGNKYAIQSGISIPIAKAELSAEITAVRPYTYAHFMNHTMYSHDGRALGYPKGSNILDLTLQAKLPIPHYAELCTSLSLSRYGSEGRSWRDNYHDIFGGNIQDGEAHWFDGEITDEITIQNSLYIPIMAHHRFLFGHESKHAGSWNHRGFASWQIVF